MKHSLLIYLFIMVLVTNLIRVLPMTLIRRRITHPFLRSFLYYVPYVTLAVMTFPAIMEATSSPWGGFIALLIGGALIAAGLTVLRRFGLAAAVTAIVPGAALCLFIHKCYWYVVDVLYGIDEKHGFDPKFITFVALVAAAFVIGEIAIYTRKTREK